MPKGKQVELSVISFIGRKVLTLNCGKRKYKGWHIKLIKGTKVKAES